MSRQPYVISELDTDELVCEWSEPEHLRRTLAVKYLAGLSRLQLGYLIEHLQRGYHQLRREIVGLKARLQSETTVTTQESEPKGQAGSQFPDARTRGLVMQARGLRQDLEKLLKEKEALEVEWKKMENEKTDLSSTTHSSD